MDYTTNLNLKKPALNEWADINDLNENNDKIDEAVGKLQEGTAEMPALETDDKTYVGAINEINTNVEELETEVEKKATKATNEATATAGQALKSNGDGTFTFEDLPASQDLQPILDAIDALEEGTAEVTTLETDDKTYAGAINEINTNVEELETEVEKKATKATNEATATAGQVLKSNGDGTATFEDDTLTDDTTSKKYAFGINNGLLYYKEVI